MKIAELRKEYGYSVKQLCDLIGCSRPQLYNLENGRYDPDDVKYGFMRSLASVYDKTITEIAECMAIDHYDFVFEKVCNYEDCSVDKDQYRLAI